MVDSVPLALPVFSIHYSLPTIHCLVTVLSEDKANFGAFDAIGRRGAAEVAFALVAHPRG